jgi:hypothetical protein
MGFLPSTQHMPYVLIQDPHYSLSVYQYVLQFCNMQHKTLVAFMKHLNIREMRSNLGKLDILVDEEQELIITRNKQAIARVLPVHITKTRPSHAELRALQCHSEIASEDLIRQDRDER